MSEIEAVVRDLKPRLEGGRIERIDQPDRHKLILSVRNGPARFWLLICAHPRFSRLHLLTTRPGRGKPAAGFCNVVRQHMTGAPLEAISQVCNDRVVIIESVERDRLRQPHRVRLVAELTGAGSNLLLVNEANMILGALFREDSSRRKVAAGMQYQPLRAPSVLPAKARLNRFERAPDPADPLALSREVQAHYARLEATDELEWRRSELLRVLKAGLRKRGRRLQRITADLQRAEDAETIRRKGELLKIALPRVKPGQREVAVEDLFEPHGPQLVIELNPALSPKENIGWLFQRYKKAVAGQGQLAQRADDTRREMEALEELRASAETAQSGQELAAVKEAVLGAGLTFPKGRPPKRPGERRRGAPRAFRSAEGLEILVARNQRENDRLTFAVARGNDYWMHLLDWPGPHVVIRKPPDKGVSLETLLDAAHLAVHFSKIRGAEYAEVGYTQCKNVRRMRGAGPGKVSYSQASTLRVRLSPDRLRRLLDRADEPEE